MSSRKPRLYSLPYSPWSEKARWALDHHGVAYDVVEHQLFVGDLRLRILLRKPKGRVTVPVLDEDGVIFSDSFDIARHADVIGSGSRLFPAGREAEIEAWNQRGEALGGAVRAIMILKLIDDPEAAKAALPPMIPASIAPLLLPVGRGAMQLFAAKYNMRDGAADNQAKAEEILDAAVAALDNQKYLLGDTFTYADVALACMLQGVRPVDKRFMPGGPGGRRAWTHTELADRYAKLLEWRDELYEKHRKPRA